MCSFCYLNDYNHSIIILFCLLLLSFTFTKLLNLCIVDTNKNKYNYNTLTWQELCDGFLWDEDSLDEFDDNFKGCKI